VIHENNLAAEIKMRLCRIPARVVRIVASAGDRSLGAS
jgi:hypothetical protein